MALSRLSSETWDWPTEMKRVSRAFCGREGVFLQFGDSLTLAFPNVLWVWSGPGHSPAERSFLTWAHAGENSERDGWYLAATPTSAEDPTKTTFTAAMGCSAKYLVTGGKGLPRLDEMIAMYRPQMAVYSIGASEVIRRTLLPEYVRYVEDAIDLMVGHGSVPIIATVTPSRSPNDGVQRMNGALRALAERRKLPLVDVYAEMERLNDNVLDFLGEDGVHLT